MPSSTKTMGTLPVLGQKVVPGAMLGISPTTALSSKGPSLIKMLIYSAYP